MMSTATQIIGWTPPDNVDYLDVAGALLPAQNPPFHISEPNPIKQPRRASSGNFEAASPASSTSALSADGDYIEDKRAVSQGKQADPEKIARPRNEFILFRCDYVAKHQREGKRVRRAPGAEAEKTLSKQAAEAWHELSPEERLYWKGCANQERNEHARQYPNYRYRPKKSVAGRRRQTRTSPSKANNPGSPTKTPHDESPNDSGFDSVSPSLTRQSSTADFALRRLRPRKSTSVPEFGIVDSINRRLRSTASHGWIAISGTAANGRLGFGHASRGFLAPTTATPPLQYVSPQYSASPTPQPAPGLVSSMSSSLLNWNGERMVAARPQPTQFLSSTSISSLPGMNIIETGVSMSEFTSGGNPIPTSNLFETHHTSHYRSENDVWLPQLNSYNGPDDTIVAQTTSEGEGSNSDIHNEETYLPPPPPPTGLAPLYESMEQVHTPHIDYSLNSSSVDLLGGGIGSSSPENIFSMDNDELFTQAY